MHANFVEIRWIIWYISISKLAKPLPCMLNSGGPFLFRGYLVKYSKPALTFEAQADLLSQRGLDANRDQLIAILQSVSYYRLSGYLYPFRNVDDTFKYVTTLERVWRRYTFERRLRLLTLDAI